MWREKFFHLKRLKTHFKIIKILLFAPLLIYGACKTANSSTIKLVPNNSAKRIEIALRGSDSVNSLPYHSKNREVSICISNNQTIFDTTSVDNVKMIYLLKGDTLHVECIENNATKRIKGQFYIPPIYGVRYMVGYELETLNSVANPMKFYMPIKVGTWFFYSDNDNYKTQIYNNKFDPEFYDANCIRKQ
jgi:hypothetical protein